MLTLHTDLQTDDGAPAEMLLADGHGGYPAQDAGDDAKDDEGDMATSAERMTILRMIEQGKISAEEGARLLKTLGNRPASEQPIPARGFDMSRSIQVRVHDLATNRQKVNVTVPIGLVQLIWQWIPITAQEQLEQIKGVLDAGVSGRLAEVVDQDSGVRVEITLL